MGKPINQIVDQKSRYASGVNESRGENLLRITINGKEYFAKEGETVLDVARRNNIFIPTLCFLEKVGPIGACRLCVVEVEGLKIPVTACTTRVKDGMVVNTSTPRLERMRKEILKLILLDHPLMCEACPLDGNCELQTLAYMYDITPTDLHYYQIEEIQYEETEHPSPILKYHPQRCILCGRCVKTCTQITVVGALTFKGRGASTVISKQMPTIFYKPECISCGECLAVCPVNAIEEEKIRDRGKKWEIREVETICPYCGVGCSAIYKANDKDEIFAVESPSHMGVNKGDLCVKGRFGFDFVRHPDRLTTPLLRTEDGFKPISWSEAYDIIHAKLLEIKEKYGPDAIMGLSSARCTNEENYLFQKFMRAAIGTNNVDHCARLCHSSTVAGLKAAFGAGAMTNSIEELDETDLYFVTGSNTTETHPIIGRRIKRNVDHRGAQLIVADPRKIELVKFARIWLRHRPGTDIALLNGLAHVIYREGLWDREFVEKRTAGFDEFVKAIEEYTPEKVEAITGVKAEQLIEAARLIGRAKRATFIYAMGITQHKYGTDAVKAIANLALLTGNVGRRGTGVDPLRGQNNVQGACDLGALPNVFPGYQPVTDPSIRSKFEQEWGVSSLPEKPGIAVSEMAEAVLEGRIKAAYIMGENAALTDAELRKFRQALEQLAFLVVQDIFLSETAQYADIVLPAACSFEKDGTFTNTERRVQRVRKVVDPIGSARPDWVILRDLLEKFGVRAPYNHPSDIFEEIRRTTPQYSGITYRRLEKGGIQWPCYHEEHPGTMFLYAERFNTPDGKGHFHPVHQIPDYGRDSEFPFILTTGRMRYHYHTGTMSRRTYALNKLVPEGYVEINPKDAAALKIKDGDRVKLVSRKGEIEAKVRLSDQVPEGVVFSTFHFSEIPVNVLADGEDLDPVSKIPEYKVIPIRIEPIAP